MTSPNPVILSKLLSTLSMDISPICLTGLIVSSLTVLRNKKHNQKYWCVPITMYFAGKKVWIFFSDEIAYQKIVFNQEWLFKTKNTFLRASVYMVVCLLVMDLSILLEIWFLFFLIFFCCFVALHSTDHTEVELLVCGQSVLIWDLAIPHTVEFGKSIL